MHCAHPLAVIPCTWRARQSREDSGGCEGRIDLLCRESSKAGHERRGLVRLSGLRLSVWSRQLLAHPIDDELAVTGRGAVGLAQDAVGEGAIDWGRGGEVVT